MGNFVTAAPNEAVIISGRSGTRICVGKTGFKLWVLEAYERLPLELLTIKIVSTDAETCRGVPVNISAIAQVKVNAWRDPDDEDGEEQSPRNRKRSSKDDLNTTKIQLAAQHFLGSTKQDMVDALQKTLEGHQRQILGTLTVEELYKDRQAFSASVRLHVCKDLAAMGFKLVSYTVSDISDNSDYMLSLGVTQTAQVKREAAEGEAKNQSEARKKVAEYQAQAAIAEANHEREAHVVKAQQREQEAEADRDLNLKKAAYAREVNQAQAEASAAGPIESAKQQQAVIREKTRQIEVEEKIKLDIADQIVAREIKEKTGTAEAQKLAEDHAAEAIRVLAQAEADKVRVTGEAEADVIRKKGEAEAEVLERKAQAYKQYGEAATLQMIIERLPEIAEKVSAPLAKTEKMTFVSSDGSTGSQLTRDVGKILGQLPDVVEGITGFDMRDALKKGKKDEAKSGVSRMFS